VILEDDNLAASPTMIAAVEYVNGFRPAAVIQPAKGIFVQS